MKSMGGSVQLPGINDLQAVDAFKVFGVAGDELEVGSEGDSGNLGVWYVNGSSCCSWLAEVWQWTRGGALRQNQAITA